MISNEGLSFDSTPYEWVDNLLRKDAKFKDLSTLLISASPNSVSVSGLSSSDYPLSDCSIGGSLDITNRSSFPFEVIERFSNIQYHCLSGIFDECNRIYVTIDNDLFLWNYSNEEDLFIYENIQDPIIAIHFCKPKKDHLPPELNYILILATTTEIFIFGIHFDDNEPSSFQFYDNILYRISTDDQIISCISSTFDSRLILGTKEGNILELNYKKLPDSFIDSFPEVLSFNVSSSNLDANSFGVGECTIVNWSTSSLSMVLPNIIKMNFQSHDPILSIEVDNVRLILYTLSTEGNITVYSFGNNSQNRKPKGGIYSCFNTYGQRITKIDSAKSSSLASKAYNAVSSISRDQFKKIIKIFPLIGHGDDLYLMALTSTGIRLFLDGSMNLKHVRLPPTVAKRIENASDSSQIDGLPLDSNDRIQINFQHNQIKFCVESRGSVLMLGSNDVPMNNSLNESYLNQSSSYESANVYLISPDIFPWSSSLKETCAVLGSQHTIPSNVWGIYEINKFQDDPNDLLESQSSNLKDSNVENYLPERNNQENEKPNSGKKIKSIAPIVLTQHLDNPSREFVLISPEGIIKFSLPSPLTRLHQFLSIYANYGTNITDKESSFLPKYLQLLGPEESIAASLYVGGNASTLHDNRLEELAIETIHFFANSSGLLWSPSIQKPIDGSISDQNELNTINYELFLLTGVWLFISRLLKPFWKSSLFNFIMAKDLSKIVGLPFNSDANQSSWDPLSLVKRLAKSALTKLAFDYKLNEQNEDPIGLLLSPNSFFKGLSETDILLMNSFTPDDYIFIRQYLDFASDFINYSFGVNTESKNIKTFKGLSSPRKEIQRISNFSKSIGIFAISTNKFISSCKEILGLTATLSKYPVYQVSRLLNQDTIFTLSTTPFSQYIIQMFKMNQTIIKDQALHQSSIKSNLTIETLIEKLNSLMNAFIEFAVYTSSSDKSGSENAILLETLSMELRNTCPTLFSDQDALCAKGAEYLQISSTLLTTFCTKIGRQHLLLENLRLLDIHPDDKLQMMLIEQRLSSEDNQLILEFFSDINFNVSNALKLYFEAVTLTKNSSKNSFNLNDCITRLIGIPWADAWRCGIRLARIYATLSDPTNMAVEYFRRGISSSNLDSISLNKTCDDTKFDFKILENRMEAYKIILNVLDNLLEMARLPVEISDWNCHNLSLGDYKIETVLSTVEYKTDTAFKGPQKNIHSYVSLQSSLNLKNSAKLNPFLARALLHTILCDLINQNTQIGDTNETSDILSQYEAIGWLIQQGLEDKLMSLTSGDDKVLESYLHLRLNIDPTSVQLRELLNKVLIRKGAFAESARVLEHLATEPCSEAKILFLQDRIENLSRAIISLKAVVSDSIDLEYQNQLKERYDVALMQQNLLNELMENENTKANNEMKQRLNKGSLMTLTEQFTDVAVPFSLHKSRLCILQMSKYQDTELIKKFWDEFLAEILYSIRPNTYNSVKTEDFYGRQTSFLDPTSSPTNQGGLFGKMEYPDDAFTGNTNNNNSLAYLPDQSKPRSPYANKTQVNTSHIISQLAKISSMLMREKYSQERFNYLHESSNNEYLYFPIDLIVERLERFAASKSLHYSWVINVFLKANLSIDLAFIKAMTGIFYSVDKFWRTPSVQEHHLLAALFSIKNHIEQKPNKRNNLELQTLLQQETKLVSALESLKDKNTEIRQLYSAIVNNLEATC